MESFWSTEYGQNLLSVEQTEIDKLLTNSATTTLEELFDEDELLQQCSNKNTQLINFLSRRDNITKLVSYITRPWQEHMQQIKQHLKEREEKKQNDDNNQDTNNDTTNSNNNNPTDSEQSPLSKNGTHSINGIKEESTESTPQSLADALMSLEENNDNDDKSKVWIDR